MKQVKVVAKNGFVLPELLLVKPLIKKPYLRHPNILLNIWQLLLTPPESV